MAGWRIGQGFDVHAFEAGDHVMLAGVRIPHDKGLKAYSDGDVALHALADALLGAVALGDIGQHFPDTDPAWKGVDSSQLLSHVYGDICAMNYQLVNLDLTLICQQPKIAPHIPAMREQLSHLLAVSMDVISVKATTTEYLGFAGRGEGIAAMAVVLVQQHD